MASKFYTKWINSLASLPIVSLAKHTARVKRWFADLDRYAQKEFKKNYSNLAERQRTQLHENINAGKYVEKKDPKTNVKA
jgi:hypothetical protein